MLHALRLLIPHNCKSTFTSLILYVRWALPTYKFAGTTARIHNCRRIIPIKTNLIIGSIDEYKKDYDYTFLFDHEPRFEHFEHLTSGKYLIGMNIYTQFQKRFYEITVDKEEKDDPSIIAMTSYKRRYILTE